MRRWCARTWWLLSCGVAAACGGKSDHVVGYEHDPSAAGSAMSSSGAGSVGSAAGSSGVTDAETPTQDRCAPIGAMQVQANSCALGLQCPGSGAYVNVNCNGVGSDDWTCSCNDQRFNPNFQVAGLSGAPLCSAVADFCTRRDSPAGTGRQCSLSAESRSPSACHVQRDCTEAVGIGTAATAARTTKVTCNDTGMGQMACSCDYGPAYLISDQDGTTACDAMLALCSGDAPLDYASDNTCMPGLFEETREGFCGVHPICQRNVNLGGGATAVENANWELDCTTSATGGASCACINGMGAGVPFDIDSAVEGQSTCTDFTQLCGIAAPVARSNDVTCHQAFQAGDTSYCSIQLDCTQEASFAGQHIRLHGTIVGTCGLVGDQYVCTCVAADEAAQIQVKASSVWEACSAAGTRCPNAVKPVIGDKVIRAPVPAP